MAFALVMQPHPFFQVLSVTDVQAAIGASQYVNGKGIC
jgi:hypothetical protein